jgi:hypothetical protein
MHRQVKKQLIHMKKPMHKLNTTGIRPFTKKFVRFVVFVRYAVCMMYVMIL